MKKFYIISIICLIIGIIPNTGQAQIFNQPPPSSGTTPPPFSQTDNIQPGDPFVTDTPIDGGVVFLILIGLALGIRRFKSKSSILEAS